MTVEAPMDVSGSIPIDIPLKDADAQMAFGQCLAGFLVPPFALDLDGDLGTGKTTLARGILRGLGHAGAVRSPTYTLIEPYELAAGPLYHLDLYRLADPDELEYLGLRDLLTQDAIRILEWPERGAGALPPPDLLIQLDYLAAGRRLRLRPGTASGTRVAQAAVDAWRRAGAGSAG